MTRFIVVRFLAYYCFVLGLGEACIAGDRQSLMRCGAHSVYILLRMHDHSVNLTDILRLLPDSNRGTSLLDMQQALFKLGHQASIESFTLPQISNRCLPLIVYMKGGVRDKMSDMGHFVVLLEVSENMISFIDGTRGGKVTVSKEWFASRSPGYLLRLEESRLSFYQVVSSRLLTLGLLLLVTYFVSWSGRGGDTP